MSKVTCSICGKQFESSDSQHMPFCGKRCQEVDLSRWLGEEYGLPLDGHEDREDELRQDSSTENGGDPWE